MAGLLRPFFATNNGKAPHKGKGPQASPATFDFSTGSNFNIDVTTAAIQAGIDSVQSLFVDNSANPFKVTIFSPATNQTLTVPGFAQATLPFLGQVTGSLQLVSGTGASGNGSTFAGMAGLCNVYFLNVPMPFHVWTGREYGTITQFTEVNTVVTAFQWVDILPANPKRRGLMLYPNNTGNINTIFIYMTAAAATASGLAGAGKIGMIFVNGSLTNPQAGIGGQGLIVDRADPPYIGPVAVTTNGSILQAVAVEFIEATQPATSSFTAPPTNH